LPRCGDYRKLQVNGNSSEHSGGIKDKRKPARHEKMDPTSGNKGESDNEGSKEERRRLETNLMEAFKKKVIFAGGHQDATASRGTRNDKNFRRPQERGSSRSHREIPARSQKTALASKRSVKDNYYTSARRGE